MGFLRKLLGGAGTSAAPKAPTRAQPETKDLVELCWQTLQDLVDEFNKGGPSGTLVGLPLQQRIKLRDEITAIGERLGVTRADVKARPRAYVAKTIGQLCRDLADQAKTDPYCQLPLDPDDPSSPAIAQRCEQLADRVRDLERQVEHERKVEHDRRKL